MKKTIEKTHLFEYQKSHLEQDTSAITFDNLLDIPLQRNVSDFLKFQ